MNTVDEMIEVLQAYKDGESIEFNTVMGWIDVPEPCFNFQNFEYRIKLKLKSAKGWVNIYDNGTISYFHKTKENALRFAGFNCIKTVFVREIE